MYIYNAVKEELTKYSLRTWEIIQQILYYFGEFITKLEIFGLLWKNVVHLYDYWSKELMTTLQCSVSHFKKKAKSFLENNIQREVKAGSLYRVVHLEMYTEGKGNEYEVEERWKKIDNQKLFEMERKYGQSNGLNPTNSYIAPLTSMKRKFMICRRIGPDLKA